MTEPLLEIKGVRKQFGGLSALAGLDMHVDAGEILSVIGPNGAGKSTLFNVITGLYAPDDGRHHVPRRQHRRVAAASGSEARVSPARSRTCTCSRT